MPILYRDGSMLGLGYRVDPRLTREFLSDVPLEAVTIFGKAVVSLVLFEYRDTTIGAYNELSINILTRQPNTSPSLLRFLSDKPGVERPGWFVVVLPVDSKAALASGVELWGYPKYLARFETAFRPGQVRATLAGELSISHSQGFGVPAKGPSYLTYTVRNRRLIRTPVAVNYRVRFGGARSVRVEVLGDGPAARAVRSLGLHNQRPMLAFRTDRLRTVLPQGTDVGPSGEPHFP